MIQETIISLPKGAILYVAAAAYGLLFLWWWDAPLRFQLWARRHVLRDKTTPRLPPGNFGLPLLGHLPWVLWNFFTRGKNFDVLGEYQRVQRKWYGPIRCGSLPPLGMRFICVSSDDALQWVLSKENKGFEERVDTATATLLGPNSLIFLTGRFHKKMRGALMPLFQPSFLSTYCRRMNEILQDHLSKNWSSVKKKKKRILVQSEMKLLTFKIISDLILGIDHVEEFDTVKRLICLFQTWFDGILMPTFPFPGNPYPKALQAREEMKEILTETIRQYRAKPADDGSSVG